MKPMKRGLVRAVLAASLLSAAGMALAQTAPEPAPRAPSTPNTPKNWAGPQGRILAQVLVDELIAGHPEIMSITMHANPPGAAADVYTMIAGSFPDRIGNQSSPGDVITLKKGVSQVESKWGTPDWQKKVSTVLPLKDTRGNYLPVAMVIAFKTAPGNGKKDTDFLAPGLVIRDGLNSRIPDVGALFSPVR